MPGAKSVYIEECIKDGFIGVDFDLKEDLSSHLTDDFKLFSKKYSPIFIKNNPEKSKVASGLASGSIWTVCHDLKRGDIVLSPDGKGEYLVGEIDSNYYYADGEILPHRRKVKWNNSTIRKNSVNGQVIQYDYPSINLNFSKCDFNNLSYSLNGFFITLFFIELFAA